MQRKVWYSTEEVAALLGMSPAWVRRQVADGRLKAVAYEVGARRTYRVRAVWIEEFIREYRRGPEDI